MTARRRIQPGLSRHRPSARVALAAFILSAAIHGTAHAEQYRVLALHAASRETTAPLIADQTIQRALSQRLRERLDYYSEFIDVGRFPAPGHRRALRDLLKSKYVDRLDLLIATSNTAVEVATAKDDELFAGLPLVFSAGPPIEAGPRSTGATYRLDLARTLVMVDRLQPDTKRVVVVSGSSAFDQGYTDLARAQFRAFDRRFEFDYWSGLPMPELLQRAAALPEHSVLYCLMLTQDGSGQRFLPHESLERIAAAANRPTYAASGDAMDHGTIGGSLFRGEIVGQHLADLALRVLAGEKPEEIPVIEIDPSVDEVDWRQLRRFGIGEARVPAGTLIRFREPGLWERYRSYVIGTVALLLVQTALIGGLLVQRVRRRRAEVELRASETALRTSHQQNQDLAGRLITAQEAERARIARELHDDAIQQLAGLSIVLSGLRRRRGRGGQPDDVDETLARLEPRISDLSDGLRSLSHELHSGVLEHAGLVAALKQHCREFAQHHGLDVSFSADGDGGALDPDVALCLYRVAQEALSNTARHARARTAQVRLALSSGRAELGVVDDGLGFDPDRRDGTGLGLRSIGERVRFAKGSVTIESRPGHGTKVRVWIPISTPAVPIVSAHIDATR